MTDASLPDPANTLLSEYAAEWLGAASRRRSRRAFEPTDAEPSRLARLSTLCDEWHPYPDARVVLVAHPAIDIFTGIVGSYGKVKGAPHVLVFIGDERTEFTDQHVGYTGEAIVLEATVLGLATCWVGGFFSAKRVAQIVELGPGERAYAVSPLGTPLNSDSLVERTMAGMAGARKRKRVTEIAPGIEQGDWPTWAVAAVETARVAPSAMNRQPWRFRFEDGGLVIAKDAPFETPKVTKRFDIGIAMLHVELAAHAHGLTGRWTDLVGSDVARFDPDTSR
ncbi:MAG: nitroreductase family protein [Coriobacteriia bacterium]|nr:nitroreductase family protein [Coriobacteriia bacterium]